MIEREDKSKVVPMGGLRGSPERLPYTIELRTADGQTERVVGRAASAVLARAIFTAARSEHAGRRIVLRRGGDVIEEAG